MSGKILESTPQDLETYAGVMDSILGENATVEYSQSDIRFKFYDSNGNKVFSRVVENPRELDLILYVIRAYQNSKLGHNNYLDPRS